MTPLVAQAAQRHLLVIYGARRQWKWAATTLEDNSNAASLNWVETPEDWMVDDKSLGAEPSTNHVTTTTAAGDGITQH